jgi:hypothetical protein
VIDSFRQAGVPLFEIKASDRGPQEIFEGVRAALESDDVASKNLSIGK